MSNPNQTHFRALDRIQKYLNNYNRKGILYYKDSYNKLPLKGYTYSDQGSDVTTRNSTTRYIFQLNNNIISQYSQLQKSVALSSYHAEYIAIKEGLKELIYLYNLIEYLNKELRLNIFDEKTPIIFTDSESAIKLSENLVFYKKSKHIEIQYYFITECIRNNIAKIAYINTRDQLADALTKGLDTIKHKTFFRRIKMIENS